MRRLAALLLVVAIGTLVPVVAWASLTSVSCCASKQAPAPMSCCTTSKCSMSTPVSVPVTPKDSEAPQASKVSPPGPAVVASAPAEAAATSPRTTFGHDEAPTPVTTVDRRLALLSTYLI